MKLTLKFKLLFLTSSLFFFCSVVIQYRVWSTRRTGNLGWCHAPCSSTIGHNTYLIFYKLATEKNERENKTQKKKKNKQTNKQKDGISKKEYLPISIDVFFHSNLPWNNMKTRATRTFSPRFTLQNRSLPVLALKHVLASPSIAKRLVAGPYDCCFVPIMFPVHRE